MNGYVKKLRNSPRNPKADNKASHVIDFIERNFLRDSSGVFQLENWVVLHGSYDDRMAEFENIAIIWAMAQAWERGLPIGRSHGLLHWAVVVEADGCIQKVLKEAEKFWNDTLNTYKAWLAEGKPEV